MARVLITNDDGVASEGLWALARAVRAAGHDIVVVAPDQERSGAGAAIGHLVIGEAVPCARLERDDLPGVPVFALGGPPALCVLLAVRGAFGEPPDLIASGVNPGHNTGRSILHSGTVGATLTGANAHISGIASSTGFSVDGGPIHWDTTADLVAAALAQLAKEPAGTVYNLNVPNVPADELLGVAPATIAHLPAAMTRATLDEGSGGLILSFVDVVTQPAGSDTALVLDGWAALSTLVPPRLGADPTVAAGILDGFVERAEAVAAEGTAG